MEFDHHIRHWRLRFATRARPSVASLIPLCIEPQPITKSDAMELYAARHNAPLLIPNNPTETR